MLFVWFLFWLLSFMIGLLTKKSHDSMHSILQAFCEAYFDWRALYCRMPFSSIQYSQKVRSLLFQRFGPARGSWQQSQSFAPYRFWGFSRQFARVGFFLLPSFCRSRPKRWFLFRLEPKSFYLFVDTPLFTIPGEKKHQQKETALPPPRLFWLHSQAVCFSQAVFLLYFFCGGRRWVERRLGDCTFVLGLDCCRDLSTRSALYDVKWKYVFQKKSGEVCTRPTSKGASPRPRMATSMVHFIIHELSMHHSSSHWLLTAINSFLAFLQLLNSFGGRSRDDAADEAADPLLSSRKLRTLLSVLMTTLPMQPILLSSRKLRHLFSLEKESILLWVR